MGTVWSAVGGLLAGLTQILMDWTSGYSPLNILSTLVFGAACGITGSVIDSILGATVQATYYDADTKRVYHAGMNVPKTAQLICGTNILNNEQVNLVSVALATALGGWALGPWIMSAL